MLMIDKSLRPQSFADLQTLITLHNPKVLMRSCRTLNLHRCARLRAQPEVHREIAA